MELLRPLVSVNNDLTFFIFKVLKKLLKNLTSLRVCSGLYEYAEHMHQELMLKAYAQGTGAHAEHKRQELMRMLSICINFCHFSNGRSLYPQKKLQI